MPESLTRQRVSGTAKTNRGLQRGSSVPSHRQGISSVLFQRSITGSGLPGSPRGGGERLGPDAENRSRLFARDFSRIPVQMGPPVPIQRKLKVNQPGDPCEFAADRIANDILRMPEPVNPPNPGSMHSKRPEARFVPGASIAPAGRLSPSATTRTPAPPIVHDVLAASGEPLDAATRAYMEPRFGADFSGVRIHTDPKASLSAESIEALAYTSGSHIVFRAGAYAPSTLAGRRLAAHELTHVLQQRQHAPADRLWRQPADPWATADAPSNILLHPSAAPAHIRNGVLANLHGGLVDDSSLRARVSAIVGPGSTLRGIAHAIHHFYTAASAAQGTHPGSPAPTEIELAKALLVYNRYYLAVPHLTIFRDGLRLPLPIEIDRTTGDWILNSDLIRRWAASFNPVWQPLLTRRPTHLAQPDPAALTQEITQFLHQHSDALSRGIALQARVLANPFEAVFFFFRLFERLGAGAFDVALEFMNNSVNHQMRLLAGLTAGNAILRRLRMALANPPTGLSHDRRQSLQRANGMLQNALGLGPGQTAPTSRELPETPQQLANRPGGVGAWQHISPHDPAGGRHRMVLGRDVLAGLVQVSNIGGVSYTGPAYGGRVSPVQFIQQHQALLNPTNDPVRAARLALVSAISVNEGFLDAIRLRDRGVVSVGLQQSSAHVEIELPSLMHRFKTASPDLFMLYFGIYGLDVVPHGVDAHGNPRYRFVHVLPNGTRVTLATWHQILTFFGGAGGPAAYTFLTDWAARFREAAVSSREFSVAELLEAAARLDRIQREVPTITIPGHGPVALHTLINSQYGVALILDSHINQPGHVGGDLQLAANAAGYHANPNTQEQQIMNHYANIRHTHNTPARNANINAQNLSHQHGSFAGW